MKTNKNLGKYNMSKLTASMTAISLLAPLVPGVAFAQAMPPLNPGEVVTAPIITPIIAPVANKEAKVSKSSITVHGTQVFVRYPSNLNTNIQQFYMPTEGKVVVDFMGVLASDRLDVVAEDKIIERAQLIPGNDKARLVITIKKDILDSYKASGKIFSAKDVVITQSAEQTVVSFKQEVLTVAEKSADVLQRKTVEDKTQQLTQRFSDKTYAENVSEQVKQERQAKIDAAILAMNRNQSGLPVPTGATPQATNVLRPDVKNAAVTLEKINFAKITGNVGRLTLDLSNANTFANVKRADNLLVIEIPGLVIPAELKKKIVTSQMGLATKSIDILENDSGVKIILDNAAYWDHTMSQANNKVSIEVRTLSEAEYKAKANAEAEKNKSYAGKAITLNFQNMEVRALLQIIADFTGINVVASEKVSGTMTIKLNNVPWEQALDIILESKDLTKVVSGNVIWVATREEFNQKQKALLESQSQAYELEEIKLMTFQLNYHKASELAAFLLGGKSESISGTSAGTSGPKASTDAGSNRVLSKRGAVNYDARNNILFVQDTQAKLDEVSKIIRKLDSSARQVLVEAKIVIADEKFGRDLGVKYGLQLGGGRTTRAGIGSTIGTATQNANGVMTSVDTSGNRTVNTPGTLVDLASSVTGASSIAFSILNSASGNALAVELSAMETENRGRVVSSPRIVTFDNQKATIEQGTEIPYVTPGSANSPPTVSFKKAVLGLGVTPQISPNGRINMNLDIRKDTVGELVTVQGGGTVPSIDTRNLQTQVTVKNGQTLILGGVFESITRDDLRKVPFLGDLPVVGNFFKNSIKEKDRAELLIFITPYIIEDSTLDNEPVLDSIEVKKIEK